MYLFCNPRSHVLTHSSCLSRVCATSSSFLFLCKLYLLLDYTLCLDLHLDLHTAIRRDTASNAEGIQTLRMRCCCSLRVEYDLTPAIATPPLLPKRWDSLCDATHLSVPAFKENSFRTRLIVHKHPITDSSAAKPSWRRFSDRGSERHMRYGLNAPASEQRKRNKKNREVPAVFQRDKDEEEQAEAGCTHEHLKHEVNEQIRREENAHASLLKGSEHALEAQVEDPSVFQFDELDEGSLNGGVMSQWQRHRKPANASSSGNASSQQQMPRYIHAIKQRATERERERSALHDRMMKKKAEREAQNSSSAPERFVTSAYKQKLQHDEQLLRCDPDESSTTAPPDCSSDAALPMNRFYSSLLNQSTAQPASGDQESSRTVPLSSAAKNTQPSPGAEALPRQQTQPDDDQRTSDPEMFHSETHHPDHEKDEHAEKNVQTEENDAQEKEHNRKRSREEKVAAARERALARKRARREQNQ